MKKYISIVVFGLCSQLAGISAYAEAVPKLEGYFGQKIHQVQGALLSLDRSESPTLESFVYQDMNVDLTAEVSFGINGVLNLTISPEIDFVLTPAESQN